MKDVTLKDFRKLLGAFDQSLTPVVLHEDGELHPVAGMTTLDASRLYLYASESLPRPLPESVRIVVLEALLREAADALDWLDGMTGDPAVDNTARPVAAKIRAALG